MTETLIPYATSREYDPKRSGDLHSAIASTIDQFLEQYTDTLTSEVVAALDTVKTAYATGVYGRVAKLSRRAGQASSKEDLEQILEEARQQLSEDDYHAFLSRVGSYKKSGE